MFLGDSPLFDRGRSLAEKIIRALELCRRTRYTGAMRRKQIFYAIFIIAALIGVGIWYKSAFAPSDGTTAPESAPADIQKNSMPENLQSTLEEKNPIAILKTSKGDIEIELFRDTTPLTAENFVKLAKSGFYDQTKFHRVIKGFMIQGGDPNSKGTDTSKYGFGGPGYTIQDEFIAGLSNVRGTIAMANTGEPNSGGSQFFINLVDNIGLDFDKPPAGSRHPVFGKVIKGMDVIDAVAGVETGANDIPVVSVVIDRITISE